MGTVGNEPRETKSREIDWELYLWLVALVLIAMSLIGPDFIAILKAALVKRPE
jgi:hypothetical protein